MSRAKRISVLFFVSVVILTTTYFVLNRQAVAGSAGDFVDNSEGSERALSPGLSEADIKRKFGNLPLYFTADLAESPENAKYFSVGSRYGLSLMRRRAVLQFVSENHLKNTSNGDSEINEPRKFTTEQIKLDFVNADFSEPPTGEEELAGKVNYLVGNNSENWRTNNPTFGKVRYKNIYPGIDTVFYGNQNELEYDFVVAPHAAPEQIALEFSGTRKIEIDKAGNLILKLKNGEIVQRKPFAFQQVNGKRRIVKVKFIKKSANRIVFKLGKYDRETDLVIDPVIIFSTFWGGTGSDTGTAVKTDAQGNIYLTGATVSTNFPTVNPIQPQIGNTSFFHAFVTKINPAGNNVIYSTYLGGNSEDYANSLSVDANGNVTVAGRTYSTNFPIVNASQNQLGGSADGFITRLNANGSAILFSTYLGGTGFEEILGAKLDTTGRAVLAGRTDSADFPTVAPYRSNLSGAAFFRSVNTGSSWTSGILAPGVNTVSTIAVRGSGNLSNVVYAGTNRGIYRSNDGGANWIQVGQNDLSISVTKIVVARTNPNILYAVAGGMIFKSVNGGDNWTNIQGSIFTSILSAAVDPTNADRVLVGGFGGIFRTIDGGTNWTDVSITNNFNSVNSLAIDPVNPQIVYAGTSQRIYKSTIGGGSWLAVNNGIPFLQTFSDLFIDQTTNTIYAAGQNGLYKSIDSAASWMTYNTANLFNIRSLAQDSSNPANLFAATGGGLFFRSLDAGASWIQTGDGLNPNTLLAVAATNNAVLLGGYAGTDAFVSRLTTTGSGLDYSTYIGGILNDTANSVDIGSDNLITIAGTTNSSNFPVANAIQPNIGGGSDAFITKLNQNGSALVYSTFLGGAANDSGAAVAVGSDGAAYLTGSTLSQNFPVVNAFQTTCASCSSFISDAYVAKLNAAGSSFTYSSYLGGASGDSGLSIAVDSQNRAFVGGSTASTNFPILDAVRPTSGGGTDGFISQIKSDGSGFIYSTYYGGSGTDSVKSLAIAPEGNIIAAGETSSVNFPTASPLQPSLAGSSDTFLAKIGTAADLRITISDERDPVMINNRLTLNLQVSNSGPQSSTAVIVNEIIPSGINFVSAAPTQGNCALNNSTLNCNLGNIALNSQAGIRVILVPTQTGTYSSSVSVSGSEPDPIPGDNSAVEQTTVSASPSIFGKVTNGNGQPAADVLMSLDGFQSRTIQTVANGTYGFAELPLNGNYSVRPVKNGFYFAPRSKTFNSLTNDGTADFVIAACSYNLSANSVSLGAAGGSRSIQVTTNDAFCGWSAISNVPWITITNSSGGTGNGTVKITVQQSSATRTGTLTIAGKTYTVTQTGCSFTLTPFQQSFGQNGGNGSFEVKTNESFCQWTAAVNNPWITINGSPSGTGSGIVNYTIAPSTQPRAGRISVGSRNFAVYQESNYCPSPGLAAPVETTSTADSNDIVAADFNNDGFTDLATADATTFQNGTFSTYLNTNGTLNRNTIPSNIGASYSIAAADFNQDSTIDLALLGGGGIAIFRNNGTGAFSPLSSFSASGNTGSKLYAEDFNRDGRVDLIVGTGNQIQVYNGNGNGTFSTGFTLNLTGRASYSYSFGDINGDGFTDAVVGQEQDFNVPRLSYFFGTNTGTFTTGGTISLNLTPFAVKLFDLNGDGRADILTNGAASSQLQVFLWNSETNTFNQPTRVFTEPYSGYIFDVADMDNDGKPDIISATNQGGNRVNIMRGNGNGTFRLPLGFNSSTFVNVIAFGDFNRDGRVDLAFAKRNTQMSTQLNQCGSSIGARAPMASRFDFDGDRKADFGVVRPSDNIWYIQQSASQSVIYQPFGQTGDIFMPSDYDGDGKTDFAVFRPSEGLWYKLNSADNSVSIFNWGKNGDVPMAADYDGDERTDLTVYRPDDNTWYWLSSLNGQIHTTRFGLRDDVPVTGDYDGDGKADLAVFRPDDGFWYWLNSSNGDFHSFKFGLTGDKAVPGDYDNDGKTDFAVFRPSNGFWYIAKSSNGESETVNFGKDGDTPVAADYDGDGKTDIAVYRNGYWYVVESSTLQINIIRFGTSEDKPIAGIYIR